MRVVGLVGRSGSGKTTLIEAVLPILAACGLRVSTIKHSHKPLALDIEGKDSFRHRAAGAHETLVAGRSGWALHGGRPEHPPGLAALLGRLSPVDLVLVEGFGAELIPRAEICRAARLSQPGGDPLWQDDPSIATLITDAPAAMRAAGWCGTCLPLDDAGAVAAWLAATCG
ncbi:molybdopterin-guanine dinucleotide biosynthesis protein B [Endobacter medicaginis]